MWLLSTYVLENLISLAASEEADDTFGVGNLQKPLPTTVWRSTGTTPYIVGNFASTIAVTGWGAWYTNAQAGDTARLRLATSQANLTAAPTLDTGAQDVWPGNPSNAYIADFLATFGYTHQRATVASTNATWFRIDFDYSGNSDGYVQVGSIPIGARVVLAATNPYLENFDRTTAARAGFEVVLSGGGIARGGYTPKRSWSGTIYTSQSEWLGSIQPLIDQRINGPVAMVLEGSESDYPLDYMYFGYLRARPNPGRALHTIELAVVEP